MKNWAILNKKGYKNVKEKIWWQKRISSQKLSNKYIRFSKIAKIKSNHDDFLKNQITSWFYDFFGKSNQIKSTDQYPKSPTPDPDTLTQPSVTLGATLRAPNPSEMHPR